jgi:transposase
MMGRQAKGQQVKMFYPGFCLEHRVRSDHPLRKINQLIDFDFTYKEVADSYGVNGNVSVPPPVILKLMLLLFVYNVRSERELMATIPERIDWAWFLGMDLDEPIPDHSVLSKARARWGSTAFKSFFERIVWQCIDAGLVDGSKIFMDSSLIQADASRNSVVKTKGLRRRIRLGLRELEARLDDNSQAGEDRRVVNSTHLSTTDPDAAIVRHKTGPAKPSYKVHRVVDVKSEVITAAEVTPADVNEGHMLSELIDEHDQNTQRQAQVVVADSQYGTARNYLECLDRGIEAHIPSLNTTHKKKGIFSDELFSYNPQDDTYLCPAGNRLSCRKYSKKNTAFEYRCLTRLCKACSLRDRCTTSVKKGRTIQRHLRHDEIQHMREKAREPASRRDIRTRKHLMERSFARAVRLGFKRARWRRLWRVQIQEYLTAAVQNILILVRYVKEPGLARAVAMPKPKKFPHGGGSASTLINCLCSFLCFLGRYVKLLQGLSTGGRMKGCFSTI